MRNDEEMKRRRRRRGICKCKAHLQIVDDLRIYLLRNQVE